MPKITIDGKEFTFEGKKMILQVALEQGSELPHYCYHPGLSIVASCRICLAEIEQVDPKTQKLVLQPKLFPTCQTPAADGMVVHTASPKSIANQKAVMEYLLINHPLDCPVCDQAGECSLQDYSFKYGRAESRFQEDKIKQPKKDIGLNVVLYSDRCIMCSRCVRFTKEISGTAELGIFGRGNREQIDVFPGQPLNNEMSGNVVDLCPVGALLDKDFLFAQRVWFLSRAASIDGITSSGDSIYVDFNEDRPYRVKPRFSAAVNKWWISDEVRYGWKFAISEDRLRTPVRSQHGTKIECDWMRAYEDVRERFRAIVAEKGPGSLAVLVSPMLASEEAYLLAKLVRGLDPQATLGVGPVPVQGEDKKFPGGYVIRAEKCPNSRGVKRAMELVAGGGVLAFNDFIKALADKATKIAGVVVTGNYPSAWTTKELLVAIGKKALVVIDTLPNDLTAKAEVLLPGATWLEKAGTFENAANLLQSFQQVVPPIEQARTEGQIALDLMHAFGLSQSAKYDDAAVRAEMGGIFASDVKHPGPVREEEPDMEYVEL
ncbi:MAG: molybdopterin-dependent oxidoreductase [Planctomycetes bacterium]|nr:molybdopterin-dependent oxidoreductase [Planctomycetota bacterium]